MTPLEAVTAALEAADDHWCTRNEGADYPALATAALATIGLAKRADGSHLYLSTGCLHDDHAYCQGKTGRVGAKNPGECKFCKAKCVCPCHRAGDQP